MMPGRCQDAGVRQPLVDDLGHQVPVPDVVRRVVSLVPSLTESIAATASGLLVGATAWCTHPPDLNVRRVRGTKNPDIDAVVELAPDLVVANEEENRRPDLDALRFAGLAVWVTAPRTVAAALESLHRMLAACGLERPDWLDAAVSEWQAPHDGPRRRAFVPIWRRPWMAVGCDTFAGDVLALLGVDNVYADATERYPKITLDDARARGSDLVVLPDEPYAFSPERDLDAFAGWDVPVAFLSGRHLTWYGPSLAEARRTLTDQLARACPPAVWLSR
jgi:ABC-type Fe3+-hydroxamate transport system substrate-binding protein